MTEVALASGGVIETSGAPGVVGTDITATGQMMRSVARPCSSL